VVSGAGDVLQGFDLKNGELLWTAENPGEGVAPSVLIAGDIAVQTNGWGGADSVRAFKLPGSKGRMGTKAMLWEQDKNASKLPSLIYSAPNVYSITEGGMAWCANATTGALVWRERVEGKFSASPILAGGRIYITGDEGETVVIAAAEKFEVLARNPLGENVQASPAVWRDQFIIRGTKHLIAIGQ
jgi:outer membrane protein assembly factor BamB